MPQANGLRHRTHSKRASDTGITCHGTSSQARRRRAGLRLPAFGIEALVRSRLGALLADPTELTSILPSDPSIRPRLSPLPQQKASDWSALPISDLGLALNAFVSRIAILADRVEIAIRRDRLAAWIDRVNAAGRAEG